jgi:hypothetical protein
MIIDLILEWWFGFCDWLIGMLPVDPMPQGVNLGWISDMNYFLPLSDMFGLFTIMFALGGVFAPVSLIIWIVVGIIRGGSTKA